MSRDTWNIDFGPVRGLYKDSDNGWGCGVCAGLADRFNLNLGTFRLGAVISLLLFFWMTAAIYAGLALLLREKPLVYSGRMSESEFWRRYRRDNWRHS